MKIFWKGKEIFRFWLLGFWGGPGGGNIPPSGPRKKNPSKKTPGRSKRSRPQIPKGKPIGGGSVNRGKGVSSFARTTTPYGGKKRTGKGISLGGIPLTPKKAPRGAGGALVKKKRVLGAPRLTKKTPGLGEFWPPGGGGKKRGFWAAFDPKTKKF